MSDLLREAAVSERSLAIMLLVAARIAPLTLLVPWLAVRGTPPLLRAALLFALTAALTPLALASAPATLPSDLISLAALAMRDALIGAVFAIATAVPLIALDHAGRIADALRGAPVADSTAPAGETTSPLGNLHLMLGTVLFLGLGGHRLVIAALGEGLIAVPPGGALEGSSIALSSFAMGAARIVVHALALAVSFAAPAAVSLVAIEIALGLIGRTAPAIPLHFAGMPLRAAAGLAAVLLGLSVLVPHLPPVMRSGVDAAGALVREIAR